MPKRGEFPGRIRRQRAGGPVFYWSASSLVRDLQGYPDRLIRLPPNASDAEIADLCAVYTARLESWLQGEARPGWRYDGTIGGLCDLFERHPESPMHDVKANTADAYLDSLKVIRGTVSARAIRALAPMDVKRWYRLWRAPKVEGGPERVKRAHDAVAMVRMILRFGVAVGLQECAELVEGLSKIQFERSGRRNAEMTFEHAAAFVSAALARGDARGLHMAIGVAAQFETMLRQRDVIGAWTVDSAGRETWAGSFTWENLPGGILRLR